MSLIHHRLVNIFSQQKTTPGDETLEEMTNIQLLHIRVSEYRHKNKDDFELRRAQTNIELQPIHATSFPVNT